MKTKHINQTKMSFMSLLTRLLVVFAFIPFISNAQTWTGTTVPTQTNGSSILLNPTYGSGNLSRNSYLGFSANSQSRWTLGTDYSQNGTNDLYFYGGTPSALRFYISAIGETSINTHLNYGTQSTLTLNLTGGEDGNWPNIIKGTHYGLDRFVVSALGNMGLGTSAGTAKITLQNQDLGATQYYAGNFIEARIGTATSFRTPFKVDYNGTVMADKAIIGDGTTNYPLAVNGGIMTTKVRVATVGSSNWSWPDYVFSKDYKLKSLYEVESYINENKHLHNIPSAEEVGKNGLELSEMNAKLLEKIEELTLYLIQQQKQIDALNAKIK